MIKTTTGRLLAALALATSTASIAATLSAPVAVPIVATVPDAVDTPYPGGTMQLDIDASDTVRGVYRVTQTIPVAPGTTKLTLLLPEWLPGNHAPRGPMAELVDLSFTANGPKLQWKRDRVVAVAKHYIGLPYRHHHIPAWSPKSPDQHGLTGPGLDCSNFTAWVYNFGFGVILNSDVALQAAMKPRPGFAVHPGMQRIGAEGPFMPGDIIYIANPQKTAIVHAIIFIDDGHIIDSTDGQVAVRHFTGWYRRQLSHAIRIFNE